MTEQLTKAKKNKHGAACKALGMKLVVAAFTTVGGWGKEMLKKLKVEYEERKKQEKKDGGSGWESIKWKQDLMERVSIAIARANYNLLSAHTRPSMA